MSIAIPGAGKVFDAFSELVPQRESGADTTYPDPFVRVSFNESVGVRTAQSETIVNTIRPNWAYAFYVRLDGLRETGIDITVLDDDTTGPAQIGTANIPRTVMELVAQRGRSAMLERADGDLEQLLIRVEPVIAGDSSGIRASSLPLAQGANPTDFRVPLGATISVKTTGAGTIGGGFACTPDVTPSGLPAGECQSYNLTKPEELANVPHGSAVALFGSLPAIHAVSLALEDQREPCVRFAAPASGPIVFAINDRDFQNDTGTFTFEFTVAPPPELADELPLGRTLRCDGGLL